MHKRLGEECKIVIQMGAWLMDDPSVTGVGQRVQSPSFTRCGMVNPITNHLQASTVTQPSDTRSGFWGSATPILGSSITQALIRATILVVS